MLKKLITLASCLLFMSTFSLVKISQAETLYVQWTSPKDASAFVAYSRYIYSYVLEGNVSLEAWIFTAGGTALPCYPGKPCPTNINPPNPFPKLWFTVDGVRVAGPFDGPPYNFTLDTTQWADGSHVLGQEVQSQDSNTFVPLGLAVTFANTPVIPTFPQTTHTCPNKFLHRVGQDVSGQCERFVAQSPFIPLHYSLIGPRISQPYALTPLNDSFYYLQEMLSDDIAPARLECTQAGYCGVHNTQSYFYTNQHKSLTSLLDGPRGSATAGSLTSGFVEANGSFVGVAAQGRVVRVTLDGVVTTLAGVRTRQDVAIPYWNEEAFVLAQQEFVGVMNDGPSRFFRPRDVIVDLQNPQILFVADTQNHRIVKVDLSQNPVQLSTYAGSLSGQPGFADGVGVNARFREPWNLFMLQNGHIGVTDRLNHALRDIAPDGTVTTLISSSILPPSNTIPTNGNDPGRAKIPSQYLVDGPFTQASFVYPEGARLDSEGNLIVGENYTRHIRKVNFSTQTVQTLVEIPAPGGSNTNTVSVNVNAHGTCGDLDAIFLATTETTGPWILGKNGSPVIRVLKASLSSVGTGRADKIGMSNRYPMFLACGPDGSLWTGGYLNSPMRATPYVQGDFAVTAADVLVLKRGEEIYQRGTVLNFPPRSGFNLLHGLRGFSSLGYGSFDDLVTVNDVTLSQMIQAGWFSLSGPRPEITGKDLKELIYYIRSNCHGCIAQGVSAPTPEADNTSPILSAAALNVLTPSSIQVSWNTDENAISVLEYGMDVSVPNYSMIESQFNNTHSLILQDLTPGQFYYVRIRSRDMAGNQSVSDIMPVTMPEN